MFCSPAAAVARWSAGRAVADAGRAGRDGEATREPGQQKKKKKMLHPHVQKAPSRVNHVRSKLCMVSMIHNVFMLQHVMAKKKVTCNVLGMSRAWRGQKMFLVSN
jgi:hypothetical protein